MSKWLVLRKGADFEKISRDHGISPITARLLRNRGLCGHDDIEAFLKADISSLHEPEKLKDMQKAVGIMTESINKKEKIRIIGDYDVDGICSAYILYSGLKKCGACVDVKLPHRIHDGYGLNLKLIDEAYGEGVNTIITCDNGISAKDPVKHAKELGMTIIVTDHHEVPKDPECNEMILPAADAVVDPRRSDDDYPFSDICGAMVAYKFICLLLMTMEKDCDKDFLMEMRIFAGLATVCDVMPLKDENRIIVADSLKNIPLCRNVGLNALISACKAEPHKMNCYSYGFVIGPCLNAAGRLDSAMKSFELLCEDDVSKAAERARELCGLNEKRKDMTTEGQEKAMLRINSYGENLPDVLVVYIPELHESLAGIIAGRVKDLISRPVFILTDSEGGIVKGSGRSIEAYHMYEALSECDDLLEKYGGHKLAAGLSLKKENINSFMERLNRNSRLCMDDFGRTLRLDMELPLKYLNFDLVREFEMLAPFGTENREPLFATRNIELLCGKMIGKNNNVGKLSVRDETGNIYEMMVFQEVDRWNEFLDENFGHAEVEKFYNGKSHDSMKVNIAYRPGINEFRGEKKIQIILQDYLAS